MKRGLILLAVCGAFLQVAFAQESKWTFNYGAKCGFSSTIYHVMDLQILEHDITDYTTKSQISLFYSVFGRVNRGRHYFQTELSYNISRYSISFPASQWNGQATMDDISSISTTLNGIEVPFYYGYHFIHEGPYGISFYSGPKVKVILPDQSKHLFENFTHTAIEETVNPVNFSLMFGIGIHISRICFDFSFEYGLNNISRYFTTQSLNGETSTHDIIFNRRKNVLSFSLGLMF